MHKVFLTEPEVAFIHGAKEIVEEIGGFPSMENGKLLAIFVMDFGDGYSRYIVSLLFDIEKWAEDSARYVTLSKPKHRYIRLQFINVRDVFIDSPRIDDCGEFKFGNTTDRTKMHQDYLPSKPVIVQRPFFSFYMGAGRDFLLAFDDAQCLVRASFAEDLEDAQYIRFCSE